MYAVFLALGHLNTAFLLIPLKASAPTVLAVSFVVLMVIFFSFLHPLNAFLPIFFIFLPMVTVVRFFMPLKTLAAMKVTGTDLPLILTAAGIVTLVAVLLLGAAIVAALLLTV